MVLGESMFNSSTYGSLISTERRHILCFHTPPEITQPLIVAYGYEDVNAKFKSETKPIGLPILQYLSIKHSFLIFHEVQRKSLSVMYFHDRFPKTVVSILSLLPRPRYSPRHHRPDNQQPRHLFLPETMRTRMFLSQRVLLSSRRPRQRPRVPERLQHQRSKLLLLPDRFAISCRILPYLLC
jgi:hypothetical protein